MISGDKETNPLQAERESPWRAAGRARVPLALLLCSKK
jgi:hypothetical protein